MKNNKKFEFNKTVTQLLNVFEKGDKEIKDFLINSYKGLPVSPEITEKFYNYFISHSVFSAATVANPSTSIITELLYDGIEKLNLSSPIDAIFFAQKLGDQLKLDYK